MPDAPAAQVMPPVVKPVDDPRFARTPKVRQAMRLIVPVKNGEARITLLEITTGGRLVIEDGSGIERSVDLNVRELHELSGFCNRIARLVATRPEWKP